MGASKAQYGWRQAAGSGGGGGTAAQAQWQACKRYRHASHLLLDGQASQRRHPAGSPAHTQPQGAKAAKLQVAQLGHYLLRNVCLRYAEWRRQKLSRVRVAFVQLAVRAPNAVPLLQDAQLGVLYPMIGLISEISSSQLRAVLCCCSGAPFGEPATHRHPISSPQSHRDCKIAHFAC